MRAMIASTCEFLGSDAEASVMCEHQGGCGEPMRTTILIVLIALSLTAPLASAEDEPASESGEEQRTGPICWTLDLDAIPPVDIYFCS